MIFDVSTDRGIRSGNQTLTEIMYRLFLESLGYAARPRSRRAGDHTRGADGRLEEFKDKVRGAVRARLGRRKGQVAFALQQASRVMHELEPATFLTADSLGQVRQEPRRHHAPACSPNAARSLMDRRGPASRSLFVIDEVGQFVARDVQKMLDLQASSRASAESAAGKMWLIVTSQEKLNELVGGLDDTPRRARSPDGPLSAPLQVHLEPSDISEVTSKRVLAKNAEAQTLLRASCSKQHRGRLTEHTPADRRHPPARALDRRRSSISIRCCPTRST